MESDFDVNRFLSDLPWVTSISRTWHWLADTVVLPAIHRDPLFIPFDNDLNDNDLNTFTKKSSWTLQHIFSRTLDTLPFILDLGGKQEF